MRESLSAVVSGWADGFSTRSAESEGLFDEEQIARIVAAGESGARIADLCAAEGISPETFYVWKVKYGGLTPDEITKQRLRDERKARTTLLVLRSIVGGALAAMCLLMAPRWIGSLSKSPATPSRTSTVPAVQASAPTRSQAAPSQADLPASPTTPAKPADPSPRATEVAAKPSAIPIPKEPPSMPRPSGFPVQVVAVPEFAEARAWAATLRNAGYQAYVTPTTPDVSAMYRVRVGPLKSRDEAYAVAQRLERDGFGTPWVVQAR